MTLLGTINTENLHAGPALCVSLCGARFNGRQRAKQGGDLILFTDPVTHSTLALPEQEVTIGNVWRKLAEKREAFRLAMGGGAR